MLDAILDSILDLILDATLDAIPDTILRALKCIKWHIVYQGRGELISHTTASIE